MTQIEKAAISRGNMERILTQEQLEAALKEWQAILRLQDWDIEVSLAPQHTLVNESLGEITYSNNRKKAIIRIATPDTFHSEIDEGQDMLDLLVHELLHLHLVFVPREELEPDLESAVNLIGEALVKMYDEIHKEATL